MLPLLRILPVGGVFLAIMIVVLALNPPGDTDSPLPPHAPVAARGALADIGGHPEWRQFLIQAALRRADEVGRLRDLPDTPTRMPEPEIVVPAGPAAPEVTVVEPAPAAEPLPPVAARPVERIESDPEEVTGSVTEQTNATLPIEIGAASSSELPVVPAPEEPPVIKVPEQIKPRQDGQRKPARPVRRAAKPAPPKPETPNLFEALFGKATQPAASDTSAAIERR